MVLMVPLFRTGDRPAGVPGRRGISGERPGRPYAVVVTTFLNALHVLLAVLVIGPLVVAPLVARRAIASRDARGVRQAANQVALFGAGSVVVAGLGIATVLAGDRWTMATPWVLISTTLYVVALGLIVGYVVPALRRAATIVGGSPPVAAGGGTGDGVGGEPGEEPPAAAAEGEEEEPAERARQPAGQPEGVSGARLDSIAARTTGAGWLLLLTFAVITVLMTVRPFG
jgi:uncharacterized membrane protein